MDDRAVLVAWCPLGHLQCCDWRWRRCPKDDLKDNMRPSVMDTRAVRQGDYPHQWHTYQSTQSKNKQMSLALCSSSISQKAGVVGGRGT